MNKIVSFLLFIMFFGFCNAQYVDLGLPSKTLWKNANENGYYEYYDHSEAIHKFSGKVPTHEQWTELKDHCIWTWTGKGCKVVGPNGKSIYLPAEGTRDCRGNDSNMGLGGYYWAANKRHGGYLIFHFIDGVEMFFGAAECTGASIRLVKN